MGVVVAGEGVPAGLIPAVPPVLHQEGRALELQRVHTHLTVYEQLQLKGSVCALELQRVHTHLTVYEQL